MSFVQTPPLPAFLVPHLPFERRAYVLERGADAGRRLHFIDEGAREWPAVLMLHGNPTWSFLWRRVIAELEGFRSLAPDLLGLGLSDRLPRIADHSLERHAEAIAELVEALELEDFVLVGQDWGGPIATAVGARVGERVAGVVLANTAVLLPERLRGTRFHRFARMPVVSDLVFRVFGFPQNALHRAQGDRGSIRGEVARAYRWPLRRWRERVAPLALARMVPDSLEHPSVPEIRRGEAWVRGFEGPMALVWGTRDPILGRGLGRHERTLSRASVRRTEAGHFLQEEVPGALAEAIREVAGFESGPESELRATDPLRTLRGSGKGEGSRNRLLEDRATDRESGH